MKTRLKTKYMAIEVASNLSVSSIYFEFIFVSYWLKLRRLDVWSYMWKTANRVIIQGDVKAFKWVCLYVYDEIGVMLAVRVGHFMQEQKRSLLSHMHFKKFTR